MTDARDRQSEETISAIKPALERRAGSSAAVRRGSRGPWLAAGAVLLAALAFAVFFVLPRLVAERAAGEQAAAPSAPSEPAPAAEAQEPALSAEERAALQERAERALADLLPQQDRLEQRAAARWGGEQWAAYRELTQASDDAFLAEDYAAAAEGYAEALELGAVLLERSGEIVESALQAGQQALAAGHARLAGEQFDIVLDIDPGHEAAREGRERAERLPEVLAAVERGEALRQQRNFGAAAEAYREALAVDPAWTPARNALAAVERLQREARFERILSAGFAALSEEEYSDAQRRFEEALELEPGSAEARDGLVQAEHGLQLEEIALAEARALAFERRELWDRAIAQYEAALATDPSLAFAREGLARSRARADLDAKLENLIENPELLFEDAVLAEARRLLGQARELAEPDTRIGSQAESLGELVRLASTPVNLRLHSDAQTEVTLYRIGPLGTFESKEVAVRPGTYTVMGSRDGYRDVRKTFTVLPGSDPAPIEVVCVEPI